MTARTVAQASLKGVVDGEDDEEAISLEATPPPELAEDDKYTVKRILAENKMPNGTHYLIEWEGYDILESTWEPEEHIESQETLDEWQHTKMRIMRGREDPFDIKWFAKQVQAKEIETRKRRRLRKEKRKRLGLSVSESESELNVEDDDDSDSSEAEEAVDEPEDIPLQRRNTGIFKRHSKRVLKQNSFGPFVVEDDPEDEPLAKRLRTSKEQKDAIIKDDDNSDSNKLSSISNTERVAARKLPKKNDEKVDTLPTKRKGSLQASSTDLSSNRPVLQRKLSLQPEKLSTGGELPSRTGYTGTANRQNAAIKPQASKGKATRGGIASSSRGGGRLEGFGKMITQGRIPKRTRAPSEPENKTSKHFEKVSLLRKAELASRNKSDREPDAPGPLMVPSDVGRRPSVGRQVVQTDLISEPQVYDVNAENNDMPRRRSVRFLGDSESPLFEEPQSVDSKSHDAPVVADTRDINTTEHFRHRDTVPSTIQDTRAEKHTNLVDTSGSMSNTPERAYCPFFFRFDECRFGDRCYYLHEKPNHLPGDRSIGNGPPVIFGGAGNITCFFWAMPGRECHKLDGQCKYAHAWTDSIGKDPFRPFKESDQRAWECDESLRRDLEKQCRTRPVNDPNWTPRIPSHIENRLNFKRRPSRDTETAPDSVPPARPSFAPVAAGGNPNITCFFWAMRDKDCSKADGQCKFAHAWTESVFFNPAKRRFGDPAEHRREDVQRHNINAWLARNPRKQPPDEVFEYTEFVSGPVAPGGDPTVTCWFWGSPHSRHSCGYNDGECNFAHYRTGKIMMDPRKGNTWEIDEPWVAAENERKSRQQAQVMSEPVAPDIDMVSNDPDILQQQESASALEGSGLADSSQSPMGVIDGGLSPTKVLDSNLGIMASFSGETIKINLSGLDLSCKDAWMRNLTSAGSFVFDRQCLSVDFIEGKYHGLAIGTVNASDSTAVVRLSTLAKYLRSSTFGLCSIHTRFSILIFPSSTEEWKEIEGETQANKDILVKYLIFAPNEHAVSLRTLRDSHPGPVNISKTIHLDSITTAVTGLTVKQLMGKQLEGVKSDAALNFFLFFPPSAIDLSALLSQWLYTNRNGAKVFDSNVEGSWQHFVSRLTRKEIGSILVHSSMVKYLHRLVSLGKLALFTPSTIWSLDDGKHLTLKVQPYAIRHSLCLGNLHLSRLFPHGAAIFLTPTFVAAEPVKTLQLLTWFNTKLAAPATSKLVLCQGFLERLRQQAIVNSAERTKFLEVLKSQSDREDTLKNVGLSTEDCLAPYKSFTLLSNIVDSVARRPSLDQSELWTDESVDEVESPIIDMDEQIPEDDEKRQADWFAGWAILHLTLFRRLLIVGTDRDSPDPDELKHKRTLLQQSNPTTDAGKPTAPRPSIKIGTLKKHAFMDDSSDEDFVQSQNEEPHNQKLLGNPNNIPISSRQSRISSSLHTASRSLASQSPSSDTKHDMRDTLVLGAVYRAKYSAPASSSIKVDVQQDDRILIIKYVSGLYYLAENLRTGYKGQVSKEILATESPQPQKRPSEDFIDGGIDRMSIDSPSTAFTSQQNSSSEPEVVGRATSLQIQQFISITGASKRTAEEFLRQSNNDVQKGVAMYFAVATSSSLVQMDGASERAVEDRIAQVWNDGVDARAAIAMYREAKTTDSELQGSRQIHNCGGLASEQSAQASKRELENDVSPKEKARQAADRIMLKVRGEAEVVPPQPTPNKQPNLPPTRFEPTTKWYADQVKEGKDWGHLVVADWKTCFNALGIIKKQE